MFHTPAHRVPASVKAQPGSVSASNRSLSGSNIWLTGLRLPEVSSEPERVNYVEFQWKGFNTKAATWEFAGRFYAQLPYHPAEAFDDPIDRARWIAGQSVSAHVFNPYAGR
jgi:hypothetical protein